MMNTIDEYTDKIALNKVMGRTVTEYVDDVITSAGEAAFWNCTSLTSVSLPKITWIRNPSVFRKCTNLTKVCMPNLERIDASYLFSDCSNIKSISLPKLSSAATFSGNTFLNCTSLMDIYVPFALTDMSASGAPWGATNATVHYNTQFDEDGNPILE